MRVEVGFSNKYQNPTFIHSILNTQANTEARLDTELIFVPFCITHLLRAITFAILNILGQL